MQYRNLGSSGLKVSTIGLGTNQFGGKVDQQGVTDIISAAIDRGINFIDTANIYQGGHSEEAIGQAIKGFKRQQVFVATKVFSKMGEGPNDRGASRQHILAAVEDSLRRLDTDRIDLYQMHNWDSQTPLEETLRTLDDLIKQGKVRYIGSSNYSGWQIAHAQDLSRQHGWHRFVSEQPHYHMLERASEQEIIPACKYFGVGILPYFPLAGGFLTGKYRQGQPAPSGSRGENSGYVQGYMTEENYVLVEQLTAYAQERGHTMGELAHAWLLAQPQISSVISGATKVEHVEANAKAADWTLTTEELAEINKRIGKTEIE